MLDRNGLRPTRYYVTDDGMMILVSEAGVIPLDTVNVVETMRLRPRKMVIVDTADGCIIEDVEIKERLASAYLYRDWLERNRIDLDSLSSGRQVGRGVLDYETMLTGFVLRRGLFLDHRAHGGHREGAGRLHRV